MLGGKDFQNKYKATDDGWNRLQVALVGTCISPGQLSGTARARSGNGYNLEGIAQDISNLYKYFLANGAKIELKEDAIPPTPATTIRNNVKRFLQSPGNAKFLYFSGHGDEDGNVILNDGTLNCADVMGWLSDVEFKGVITIMVDTCFAGKWKQNMDSFHNLGGCGACASLSLPSATFPPVPRGETFVNLRLSSLHTETSGDTPDGGEYTKEFVRALRKEHAWTLYRGSGWGTKVFVGREPDHKSIVFNPPTCTMVTKPTGHRRSDETEYVYHPNGCMKREWRLGSRQNDLAYDYVCEGGYWRDYHSRCLPNTNDFEVSLSGGPKCCVMTLDNSYETYKL